MNVEELLKILSKSKLDKKKAKVWIADYEFAEWGELEKQNIRISYDEPKW